MRTRERFRLNIFLATMLGLMLVVNTATAQTIEQKNKMSRVAFADVSLKSAIKTLTKQLKLNVVFDDSFRDQPRYELELDDVTLESALKIIFVQAHLSAKLLEENTIFVFFDNDANQARFAAYPKWSEKSVKNK
jgi:type II secretory pathway component GspD/PulD (secretin)